MTTITMNLPDALAERVAGAARAVHRPLEELLTAMLDGVVPSLDDVPEDMRTELVETTWWDDARSWKPRTPRCPRKTRRA
jgi:hypothetical protein